MGKTYRKQKSLVNNKSKKKHSKSSNAIYKKKLKKSPAIRKQINRIFRKKNKKMKLYNAIHGGATLESNNDKINLSLIIQNIEKIKTNTAEINNKLKTFLNNIEKKTSTSIETSSIPINLDKESTELPQSVVIQKEPSDIPSISVPPPPPSLPPSLPPSPPPPPPPSPPPPPTSSPSAPSSSSSKSSNTKPLQRNDKAMFDELKKKAEARREAIESKAKNAAELQAKENEKAEARAREAAEKDKNKKKQKGGNMSKEETISKDLISRLDSLHNKLNNAESIAKTAEIDSTKKNEAINEYNQIVNDYTSITKKINELPTSISQTLPIINEESLRINIPHSDEVKNIPPPSNIPLQSSIPSIPASGSYSTEPAKSSTESISEPTTPKDSEQLPITKTVNEPILSTETSKTTQSSTSQNVSPIQSSLFLDTSRTNVNDNCCGNRTIMVKDPKTGKSMLYFVIDSNDLQNAISKSKQSTDSCISNLSSSMNNGPGSDIPLNPTLEKLSSAINIQPEQKMVTVKDSQGNIHQLKNEEYEKLTSTSYPTQGPMMPEAIIPVEGAKTPYEMKSQAEQEGQVLPPPIYPQITIKNDIIYGKPSLESRTYDFNPNMKVSDIPMIVEPFLSQEDKIIIPSRLVLYAKLKPSNKPSIGYAIDELQPQQIKDSLNSLLSNPEYSSIKQLLLDDPNMNDLIINNVYNKINSSFQRQLLSQDMPLVYAINNYYDFELYPSPAIIPITISNNKILQLKVNPTMTIADFLNNIVETKELQTRVLNIIENKSTNENEAAIQEPDEIVIPDLVFQPNTPNSSPLILNKNIRLIELGKMIKDGSFKILKSDGTDYDITSLVVSFSNTYFGGPKEYRPSYFYIDLLDTMTAKIQKEKYSENINNILKDRSKLENKLKNIQQNETGIELKELSYPEENIINGGSKKHHTRKNKTGKNKTKKNTKSNSNYHDHQYGGGEYEDDIAKIKSLLENNKIELVAALSEYLSMVTYGNIKEQKLTTMLQNFFMIFKPDLIINIYDGNESMISLKWDNDSLKYWPQNIISQISNFKLTIECEQPSNPESVEQQIFGSCSELGQVQSKSKLDRFKNTFKRGNLPAQEIIIPFSLDKNNYKVNGLILNKKYKFTITLVTKSPVMIVDINNTQIGSPYIPLKEVNNITIKPTLKGGNVTWTSPSINKEKQGNIEGYLILIEPSRKENNLTLMQRLQLGSSQLSEILYKGKNKNNVVSGIKGGANSEFGDDEESDTQSLYSESGLIPVISDTSDEESSMLSIDDDLKKKEAMEVLSLLGGNPYYIDTSVFGKKDKQIINDYELLKGDINNYEIIFENPEVIEKFTIKIAAYNTNGLGKFTKKESKFLSIENPPSMISNQLSKTSEMISKIPGEIMSKVTEQFLDASNNIITIANEINELKNKLPEKIDEKWLNTMITEFANKNIENIDDRNKFIMAAKVSVKLSGPLVSSIAELYNKYNEEANKEDNIFKLFKKLQDLYLTQNIEKFKELYGNLESMTSNLKKNIDNVSNLAEKVDEMTSDYEFEVLQKLGQIAREIKENEFTSTIPSNLLKTSKLPSISNKSNEPLLPIEGMEKKEKRSITPEPKNPMLEEQFKNIPKEQQDVRISALQKQILRNKPKTSNIVKNLPPLEPITLPSPSPSPSPSPVQMPENVQSQSSSSSPVQMPENVQSQSSLSQNPKITEQKLNPSKLGLNTPKFGLSLPELPPQETEEQKLKKIYQQTYGNVVSNPNLKNYAPPVIARTLKKEGDEGLDQYGTATMKLGGKNKTKKYKKSRKTKNKKHISKKKSTRKNKKRISRKK